MQLPRWRNPPWLLLLIGLLFLPAMARADDNKLCFGRPTKDEAAAVRACTAILQRPLLTPRWKVRTLLARAGLQTLRRAFGSALADVNSALVIDPQDRMARFAHGEVSQILGRFRDAQRDMEVVLADNPNDGMALNNLCWVHAAQAELKVATAYCRKALALRPGQAEPLDTMAFVYFRSGDYDRALATYNAALARDPKKATSLYMRGVIKRKSGDIAGGLADMQAASKIAPEVAEYYARYGVGQGN